MLRIAAQPESNPTPAEPRAQGRGPRWISAETAAKRAGVTAERIRQRCREEWQAAGKAELRPPSRGRGKARWYVLEDADPSLAAVKWPEQLPCDISARSDEQRRELLRRASILERWELAKAAAVKRGGKEREATNRFLASVELIDGVKLSRSTLFEWHRGYRERGLAGLIDGRWLRSQDRAGGGDDPFMAAVQKMWLKPGKRISVCYDAACELAHERGWQIPSYKAVQRHLKSLPPQLVIKLREGDQAFKAKCEPAIERDYASVPVNGIWSSDHRPLDVMCQVGTDEQGRPRFGRPNITIWQDVRSRKVVGWAIYAHAPNSDVILRSFRQAVQTHGVPARVEIDNGKDYDSRVLQGRTKAQRRAGIDPERLEGAFGILQIDVHHVWKYHGQSKPAEAQFRTMSVRFDRMWDTWTGHKTAARPEDLREQLARGKAPTVEEIRDAFGAWLEADYNARPHGGDGMDGRSPDQVFAELLAVKRTLPEELLLFACMPWFGPVKVRKQGVTYRGLNFGAFDPEVQKLYGQKVMLAVENDDLSRVLLIDLEGKLICAAGRNERVPFNASSEDLRAAIAEKKQLRKTLKTYIDRRPRMAMDVPDLLPRHAARRASEQKPRPDNPPPSLRPHRTAFDEQLPAIQRELGQRPKRIAVGAESIDLSALAERHDEAEGGSLLRMLPGEEEDES